MDTENKRPDDIHGYSVNFANATRHGRELLEHPGNREVARDYLERAQNHGSAYFYSKEGYRYEIKHNKDTRDFSVHYAGQ